VPDGIPITVHVAGALFAATVNVGHGFSTDGSHIYLVDNGVGVTLDAVTLLETGHVLYSGTPADLAAHPQILLRYVGVRRSGV